MFPELLSLEMAFLLGLLASFFSTSAGGGGTLVFLPAISFLVPVKEAAPITSVVGGIVSIQRIFLFWRHIDYRVLAMLLPGSIAGTVLGVQLFAALNEDWILVALGLFLLGSGVRSLFSVQAMAIHCEALAFSFGWRAIWGHFGNGWRGRTRH